MGNRVPPDVCAQNARDATGRAYSAEDIRARLQFALEAIDWLRRAVEQLPAPQRRENFWVGVGLNTLLLLGAFDGLSEGASKGSPTAGPAGNRSDAPLAESVPKGEQPRACEKCDRIVADPTGCWFLNCPHNPPVEQEGARSLREAAKGALYYVEHAADPKLADVHEVEWERIRDELRAALANPVEQERE